MKLKLVIRLCLIALVVSPAAALFFASVSDNPFLNDLSVVSHIAKSADVGILGRAKIVYGHVLADDLFLSSVLHSVEIASVTAIFSLSWAVLLAVVLRFSARRWLRMLVLFVLIAPLFANYYLRTYATRLFFGGPAGFLNAALLFTMFGTVVHLVVSAVPYAFIPLFISAEGVRDIELTAAENLGISPAGTFRRLLWPLLRTAMGLSFSFAFIFAMGDHLGASMIGGNKTNILPSLPIAQWNIADYQGASAVALLSLPHTAVITFLVVRLFAGARKRPS